MNVLAHTHLLDDALPTLERLPSVVARVSLCRSEIYRRIAERSFPAPVKLGKRSIGFVSKEIDDWISQRIFERDVASGKGVGK